MIFREASIFLIGLLCVFSCNKPRETPSLQIATSANMQFVMHDLMEAFQKETNSKCTMTIGSSGKLTNQIKAGAPYDVFLSADLFYPKHLFKEGFTTTEVKEYTQGKLVLWSLKKDINYNQLNQNNIKKIVIANPKTAPYGKAASEFLKAFYKDKLNQKIIYAESISQVNQFILSDIVDLGFSSIFIVNAQKNRNKGYWQEIPSENYQTISQGIVGLKGNNQEKGKAFVDFVMSEKGQNIISSFLILNK